MALEVIQQYYNDYIHSPFITEQEFTELREMLQIIGFDFDFDNLKTTLVKLRAEAGMGDELELVPLTFDENPVKDTYPDYISVLHSRELKGDQRTTEWKNLRHNFITASVSAACAGLMGAAAREAQLLEKASFGTYSSFHGNYYTDIGNIYEPVTNSYYSYINNTRIHDFALIPSADQEWYFLAASTDGVAARGTELTNIEIKTLPGRVPDGKIKKVYYHQMQHQMACLGLNHTDFIEVKYTEHPELPVTNVRTGLGRLVSAIPSKPPVIGIIAELWNLDQECFKYEYSPVGSTREELIGWQTTRDGVIRQSDSVLLVRWIYWTQTHYQCIRVQRDPNWLRDVGPALKEFYREVLELRENPAKLQAMIQAKAEAKARSYGPEFLECLI